MTRLALLDGPATAAVRNQLVAVYRAADGWYGSACARPSVPTPPSAG